MQKVVLIMGPTASGKTDLALELATRKNIDIISVDSALIYQDMNIGTAKPDKNILKKYPHSLVNIITPEDSYSVQNFLKDVKECINSAFIHNKIPVLVGGTAFYFYALQNGLSKLPESTKDSRGYFDNLLKTKGSIYLHNELTKIDKISSDRIHQNDSQRITRALEVYYLSGKSLTELQGNKSGAINFPLKKIVLMPPRNILHSRIERRFSEMIKNDFINEVEYLKVKYNLNTNMPSMRCVGYRQVWNFLENKYSKEIMIEKSIIATRQLCKRQSTWFNNEKNTLFIDKLEINKVLNYV